MSRAFVFTCFAACVFLQPGCSSRAWYEGFQQTQREQCYRHSSQSQVDRCLEDVNKATYDDYKRKREGPAPTQT